MPERREYWVCATAARCHHASEEEARACENLTKGLAKREKYIRDIREFANEGALQLSAMALKDIRDSLAEAMREASPRCGDKWCFCGWEGTPGHAWWCVLRDEI